MLTKSICLVGDTYMLLCISALVARTTNRAHWCGVTPCRLGAAYLELARLHFLDACPATSNDKTFTLECHERHRLHRSFTSELTCLQSGTKSNFLNSVDTCTSSFFLSSTMVETLPAHDAVQSVWVISTIDFTILVSMVTLSTSRGIQTRRHTILVRVYELLHPMHIPQ